MTKTTQLANPPRRRFLRLGVLGVVTLVGVSGLSIPARAVDPPAGTSTTVPATTSTTTAPLQTGIISTTPAAPPTTTAPAPAPPEPQPGATLTLVPPTASLTPVPDSAPSPETSSAEPAPASAPEPSPEPEAAPAPRPPAAVAPPAPPRPRQLPKLLEAAATRRRDLNARVLEAESNLTRLKAELATASAAVPVLQSEEQHLAARLRSTEAQVAELDQPPVPAPPPPPPAKPAPPKAKNPVAAVWQRVVDTGRSLLPEPPANAVIVPDGVRIREEALRRQAQLGTLAGDLRSQMVVAQDQIAAAQAAVAAKAAEAEAARQGLVGARQQLSAALADVAFGPQAVGTALAPQAQPSAFALADIPPEALRLYQGAAPTCPGLSWTVLGAIGSIESSHGRSSAPGVHEGANFAGAMGPMQFLGPTWAAYGLDGDADGTADVYNPTDAVYGAANYLCANGAGDPTQLAGAIWNYNHADWYVRWVLDLAARYGGAGLQTSVIDAASLLGHPNLSLSPQAAADLAAGIVDPAVVNVLGAMANRHRIAVSVIETGHSMYVKGTDRLSNHYSGRAVDIYEVDGAPVTSANEAALELAVSLLTANSSLRPDELGSPWPELSQFPGAFSDADHVDHLHLGWRAADAHAPDGREGPQP